MAFEEQALGDRQSRLEEVLGRLEHDSAVLESLELTLAVALLDHAIAEVRRNLAA
uniref:hypothetical protein n=1 Tax=Altererythrobacter segetis TaxID=1104773 RepID=UPI00140D3FB6|nr:hypothetical protein [Altererythrobacter segetis]